jgi:hypothetical protein
MAKQGNNQSVSLGDNEGIVNTGEIGTLNIHLPPRGSRVMLPSVLGDVVLKLSQSATSNKLEASLLQLPPKIEYKLEHNELKRNMSIIEDFCQYGHMLEAALTSAEQYNPNARFFLYKNVGKKYELIRDSLFDNQSSEVNKLIFVQKNSDEIIDQLLETLLQELKLPKTTDIYIETVRFALGLVIADSIMQCRTLEKPTDVIAA